MNKPHIKWSSDPVANSLVVFGGLILLGFVAIAVGWKVSARTLDVAFQIPAVVSGGLGGLALVLIGAGFINIQMGRRLAAAERADAEAMLDEAGALLDAFKSRGRAS